MCPGGDPGRPSTEPKEPDFAAGDSSGWEWSGEISGVSGERRLACSPALPQRDSVAGVPVPYGPSRIKVDRFLGQRFVEMETVQMRTGQDPAGPGEGRKGQRRLPPGPTFSQPWAAPHSALHSAGDLCRTSTVCRHPARGTGEAGPAGGLLVPVRLCSPEPELPPPVPGGPQGCRGGGCDPYLHRLLRTPNLSPGRPVSASCFFARCPRSSQPTSHAGWTPSTGAPSRAGYGGSGNGQR